jgi:hypothetical protein
MTVFAPIEARPPSIRFQAITPWQRRFDREFPDEELP